MDKTKSKKISSTKRSERTIEELMEQAFQAQAEYEYAEAIELYSQAFADKEITLDAAYDALNQRAECFSRLGKLKDELDDLDKMVAIAQELDSAEMQMAIVYRQVHTAARLGENEKLKEIADRAAILAQESDEISVKAGASLAMGYYHFVMEKYAEAQNEVEKALRLYRADSNSEGEANSLYTLSSVMFRSGNQNQAGKYALDALEIWRARGERKSEAAALNAWSLTISDYAQHRDAKEEALEIFKSIGDLFGQGHMYNNLSLVYGHMGLYSTSRKYAKQAVDTARKAGARLGLALYLDSLARAEMNMGDYERARETFEECHIVSREIESRNAAAFALFGLGRVALDTGDPEEAKGLFQEALDTFRDTNLAADIPTTLAWLGAAYLALDDPQKARMYTAEGVTELEATGLGGTEYPPQEVWWWHYQALTYDLRQQKIRQGDGSKEVNIPDNAWSALQRAHEITSEVIQSLSDEGLRRNYFNKVEINRDIFTEWARHAVLRGVEIKQADSQPGNLQAQLQRQLAVGVGMNERRELQALTEFIMDELIELSGAERALLLQVDEFGVRNINASFGFAVGDDDDFLEQESSLFDKVEASNTHVLLQDVQQGDLDSSMESPLEALSVLCVPLLSKGKLSGFIYADNHAIFGNFTQGDVDLLAAFANQVAAALENAQLYQGLEQRVLERTEELRASNETLEQRNADLAVINEVQQGLAAKLDLQEIIDLVGDKLLTVFDTHELGIMLYETETGLCHWPYLDYRGKRLEIEPTPPKGFTGHIIETGKTFVVNEDLERKVAEYGSELLSDEITILKSIAYVPILYEGEVKGVIGLTETEREHAFDAASVRLVESVAASLGIALSNVRLFEETTQRAADLAVINEIQQGLAAKLDFDGIIELVGDKLIEIFKAHELGIILYDAETDLSHWGYAFYQGERRFVDPMPPGGFSGHVLKTGKKVVVNERIEQAMEEYDSTMVMEGVDKPKSIAFVPINSEGKVIGVIALSNVEKENAFDEASVGLVESIAASLGIALSNVRLFEETTQRAADLAVINEVQQGLSEQLEFQTIVDLVGDKLLSIFKTQNLAIIHYDAETDLCHWPYVHFQGKRHSIDPLPPGGFSGHVIRTGKPVVVNRDLLETAKEFDSELLVEDVDVPKSIIYVPIMAEGKVIGVIGLSDTEQEDAYDAASVRLVESLAASLGIALSNVRLFDETTQRAAELAVINSVQEGLAAELDIQAIYDLVGEKVYEVFDAQGVSIHILDHDTQMSHHPFHIDSGERTVIEPTPFSEVVKESIKNPKPIKWDKPEDYQKIGGKSLEGTREDKSVLWVPLVMGGKVNGFINVSHFEKEYAFSDADLRLLSTLANSLSVALDNARLFDETTQRAAELAIINSVQEGLASKLDMQGVFDLVGDQIKEIFDAQAVIITIYDRQAKMNHPRYVSEKGERFYPDSIPQTDTAEYLIRTRKPLLIRDSLEKRIEELGITMKIVQGTEIPKSLLFVPLIIGGEVQGHVSLQNVDREGAFNDSDQRLLSTLANSMGAALENARLFEETTQRAAELAVINSVQEGLAAELDMQAIYDLVGDTLREVFVGNGVAISIFDHERSLENIAYLFERGERLYPQPETISKAAQYFIASRKPIKYDTIDEILAIGAKIVEGTEAEKSGMWAPLISGETVRGQLAVFSHDEEYAFTDNDIRLLTTLANSMSVALENARLFDETNQRAADLAVINEVQQGLSEKLEFQAIIDLVGDKLMSIFKTQNLSIVTYDAETELSHWHYANWLGKKRSIDPIPLGGFSGHVIKTGKSLVINQDVEAAAKKFDSYLLDEDTFFPKSMAYVPIISEGKSIGLIGLSDAERENAYDAASVRLIESLASSLGIALSNVRLFEEINQRAAELALVNQVQEGLAAELDIQAIYDLVGDTLREVFKTDGASVTIYDLERGLDYCTYLYEEGERIYLEPHEIGEASQAFIKSRKPFKYDTLEEIEKIGGKIQEGTKAEKSGIWAPLLVGETVKGKLSVLNHEREYAYTESDLRLLTTLANSMSVALENARLFDETNQRAAELAVINSVQEGLAAELDMQAIYDLVGEKIRHVFNAQGVAISIYDHERGYINDPYAYELGERLTIDPYPINASHKKFIQDHKPLMFNSVKEYEDFGAQLVKGTKQDQSGMWVPLMVGETVKGRINVFNLEEEHAFDDADLNLLTTLANSMSVSLENARLFEETNQRAAELALINSVQQGLAAELDMQAIYDMVGDQIRDVFDAQAVMIVTYDYVNELTNIRYMVEKGERIFPSPIPISPLNKHLIENRQPLLMETSQDFTDYGSTLIDGTEYPKSGIFVPLTIGDSVRGSITLQNFDRERAYGEADVGLLSTLANSMSVALENARLFDETNQRAAELAIINSVGEAMAKQLDIETIARIVGDKVRDIFKTEVASIQLYNQRTNMVSRAYGYDRGYLSGWEGELIEGSLTSQVIHSGQPLVIGTIKEADERGAIFLPNATGDDQQVESYMGVPIIVGERVIGVVDVQSYRQNAYDDDSVRLLSTLAANMGVALENARLFQETTRRANETQALNEIGREISATLDQNAVLEQIGKRAKEILNAKDVVLRLVQNDGTLPTVVALGENADKFRKSVLKIGEGITGDVVETGVAEVIASSQADARGTHVAGTDEQEDDTLIFAPLKVRERVIGVMGLWRDIAVAGPFGDTDLDFAVGLARQAAIAIENARLFTEAERRASEMTALAEVGRDISATLDLQTVLERIATRAEDLLNARTAVIRLVGEDGSMPTVVAIGKYAEKHRGTMIQIGEGITGNVAKTGKAEIINDPRQDERIVHIPGTPQEEDELEAIIFAPLMIGERVTGVMGLWRDKPVAGPFSIDNLNLLQSLARQAANAIENAQLFQEVQRQKQYSEALLQNSPVAIMTTDLDNMVVSWNPAAENLFGYPASEAIGVNIRDLISSESVEEEISGIYEQLKRGGRVNTVTQRFRKDGSPVDVELLSLPVVMDGKKVGLIAIYHDITELLKARHEAEAANEAKSAFLATMSHEIRTPMNAIIGMTGLLLDTELDAEQIDFTETIRDSGDTLLTIINDILDFSKIEAGKMELEEQPFDLRDCVESALDLLKVKAADKEIELAYLVEDDLPGAFIGDVTRLRQILINLISNAVKFTEQGEVVLSVSKGGNRQQRKKRQELIFSVRDTGIGIPPERKDRLFQAFSQVDTSTSRKYGGTGLGLAISKRLAEMMGGEMWVESEVGKGTIFHFTIQAEQAAEMKKRPHLTGEQAELIGKRVLVVDDNATNRQILTLQGKAWGMHVRATGSSQEALSWIKKGDPFDLAILDMNMPGMTGMELAAAIRDLQSADVLPLVLFTSLGSREVETEGIEFAAQLQKPLKPSVLFDILMEIFAGQGTVEVKAKPEMPIKDPKMGERHPLRILLAEDNAVNQKLALKLLSQMGYRADVAGNGLEAIQAIERQTYDLVLMDVQMPEMDGLEATRQICSRWPRGERPRIVAMTANAMQGDRERCLEAGMDDYVSKPVRVEELISALDRTPKLN